MSTKLFVDNLSYRYDKTPVVKDIRLEIPSSHFVGIVGPNGSGKSTILKCIYGALAPESGTILLDGVDSNALKSKERARKLAVVGQENSVPFSFTVREIVAMGRTPHKKLFEGDNEHDRQMVQQAMTQVGISAYADRTFANLSGGEKQRVLIARALAQETELLILDEPTNHLDISYQLQVLEIVKGSGLTVLAAIHDLNLAAMFCDEIYVLDGHTITANGSPDAVLTESLIQEVFHVDCAIGKNPHTGKKNIVFIPSADYRKEY